MEVLKGIPLNGAKRVSVLLGKTNPNLKQKRKLLMKTQNQEAATREIVQIRIDLTNESADNLERASKDLFGIVRESVLAFGNDLDQLKEYKRGIKDHHRSTVYVMIKAASNPMLNRFSVKLPESYQTLYELHKLHGDIGDERFIKWIDEGKINPDVSKKRVTDLRDSENNKTTATSVEKNACSEEEPIEPIAMSKVEHSEPIKVSTLEEMKSAYDALDPKTQLEFTNYIFSLLTSQQKEAA